MVNDRCFLNKIRKRENVNVPYLKNGELREKGKRKYHTNKRKCHTKDRKGFDPCPTGRKSSLNVSLRGFRARYAGFHLIAP